jgi:hypothetical protein
VAQVFVLLSPASRKYLQFGKIRTEIGAIEGHEAVGAQKRMSANHEIGQKASLAIHLLHACGVSRSGYNEFRFRPKVHGLLQSLLRYLYRAKTQIVPSAGLAGARAIRRKQLRKSPMRLLRANPLRCSWPASVLKARLQKEKK